MEPILRSLSPLTVAWVTPLVLVGLKFGLRHVVQRPKSWSSAFGWLSFDIVFLSVSLIAATLIARSKNASDSVPAVFVVVLVTLLATLIVGICAGQIDAAMRARSPNVVRVVGWYVAAYVPAVFCFINSVMVLAQP